MSITSLQVCMDSSDWFQGAMSEDVGGMESSTSPITSTTHSGEDHNILTCSRPLIERRLRPQHEQALKCPRCESTHTKFCYYNNYSLSQPRYFCKTCRRYWTKGGTLRNIPVGGGCRKNKKVSSTSKKPQQPSSSTPSPPSSSSSALLLPTHQNIINHNNNNPTDLHLSFPDHHLLGFFPPANPGFLLDNPITPIDFLDNKYEALVGTTTHDSFIGNGNDQSFINGGLMMENNTNFHGICSPFGVSTSLDHHHHHHGNNSAAGSMILESCQMMIMPSDHHHHNHNHNHQMDQNHEFEVKPNTKLLSLEWHDHQQACNSDAGYNFGGLGSWTGLMNGYGSSATNPLV